MKEQSNSSKALLQRAYSLSSDSETKALYRDWAQTYDQTMVDGLGYLTPEKTTQQLSKFLSDKTAVILDVGCGTGLAGVELANAGYTNLHALDYSADMLAQADRRNIYSALIEADLNEPIDIASNTYDAMICTGTFTHAHVGANCLDELVRIMKPNGVLACTIHKDLWVKAGFEAQLSKMKSIDIISIEYQERDIYFNTDTEPAGWYLIIRKI